MNSFDLKLILNDLNVSSKEILHLMKKNGILNKLESEAARQFIQNLRDRFQLMFDAAIEDANKKDINYSVTFVIYKNDQDFLFADPVLYRLIGYYKIHLRLVEKITSYFAERNIAIGTRLFDKKAYSNWLKKHKYCNCSQHREKWGNTLTDTPIAFGQQKIMRFMYVEVKKYLRQLKKMPFDKIPISAKKFMLSKVSAYGQASLLGIIDLVEAAISLYKSNKLIAAAVLTRAAYEREVILYCVCRLLEKAENNKLNIAEDIEKINCLIVGSRNASNPNKILNILTCLGTQEKEIFSDVEIEYLYENLSNLSHPNFEGVLDAYLLPNFSDSSFHLKAHDKGNVKLTILTALNKLLGCTKIWYCELNSILEKMLKS